MSEEEEEQIVLSLLDYKTINKMIEENNNHIKELRMKNAELQKILDSKKENILTFMETNESDILESDTGDFVKKQRARKAPFGVKNVLEIVKKYIPEDVFKKIELEIKNRPKTVKTDLVYKSNE